MTGNPLDGELVRDGSRRESRWAVIMVALVATTWVAAIALQRGALLVALVAVLLDVFLMVAIGVNDRRFCATLDLHRRFEPDETSR